MACIELSPLRFSPYLKNVIWGGKKICEYKKIPQPIDNIGESWEISAMPGSESIVSEGVYEGKPLSWLIENFGVSLLGTKVVENYGYHFPLLIKFIDANDNLSIQVHPNDELARNRHNSLGKTEMWYVISTEKNAKIYSGFNSRLTPEDYESRIKEGNFLETIASYNSKPGDVYFLPAGRVHAIGSGNFLAEIQEASDITYRIFDYNRKDKNGKQRELHTELAKNAIDYNSDEKSRLQTSELKEIEELVKCEHFTTHRMKINGIKKLELDGSTFMVIICIEGKIKIKGTDGEVTITSGHTALLPAVIGKFQIEGKATVLTSVV